MTTALGVAATTAVLKRLLEAGLVRADLSALVGDVTVSALPPDRIDDEKSQVNLFLYRVTPNAAWRNQALPSFNGRGETVAAPLLPLDLHYILTAYGAEDLHAELLLGYGIELLNETPLITAPRITGVFTPSNGGPPSPMFQRLATSGLAQQPEPLRLQPTAMTTEEMSNLWGVFGEKYRPSYAFTASALLLQAEAARTASLRVRERRVVTVPLRHPVITDVDPRIVELTPTTSLVLSGSQLLAPATTVRFGNGAERAPGPGSTDERLRVTLPATLRAGVNTAQVVQRLRLATGDVPGHRGFESNVYPFVVRPRIERMGGGEPRIDIDFLPGPAGPRRSARITVRVAPPVGKRQRVTLLLNQLGAPAEGSARLYAFDARPFEAETSNDVRFRVNEVEPGDYLVRVRVDGAETAFTVGADGRPIAPRMAFG